LKQKRFKLGQLTVFCRKWLTAFAFCLGVTELLASPIDFAIIGATSFLISYSGRRPRTYLFSFTVNSEHA
jgi:hypothetical protein